MMVGLPLMMSRMEVSNYSYSLRRTGLTNFSVRSSYFDFRQRLHRTREYGIFSGTSAGKRAYLSTGE